MKITDERFLNILQCPACKKGRISLQGETLLCSECRTAYSVQDGKFRFTKSADGNIQKYEAEAGRFVNRLKKLVKESPALFMFLTYAIGSVSYNLLTGVWVNSFNRRAITIYLLWRISSIG